MVCCEMVITLVFLESSKFQVVNSKRKKLGVNHDFTVFAVVITLSIQNKSLTKNVPK